MTNTGGDLAIQLVDGDGKFNNEGMTKFAREVNLSQCGRSYAVVAIIGPQSSGKSTLLNNLFLTNFKEMNHLREICQTTKGIWLTRSPNIKPLTLVMDMEGTDGAERGEDNTAFEKQSALFALAVADVVLINMWCHDIGRNRAANLPLLSVVFEQVVNRFSNKARKITLMFVVRDKTASPEELLEDNVKKNVNKIWTSIRKPPESSNMKLSDFFKVEVVFLSNYQEKERNDFKHEIEKLQERFDNSTAPGGLVGDKKEPASGFSITAQHIWKEIMENKNLNLPSYQVMVATIRCEQIKNDKYYSFQNNEDWCKLCESVQFGFIRNFGKRVNSIINIYVSEYDKEAAYFDEAITNAKRKELVDKLLQDVQPKYQAMLNHLRLKQFKEFMEAFDKYNSDEHDTFAKAADDCIKKRLAAFDKESEGIRIERAKWDTLKERAKLQREMKSYIATKRENKVASKIRRLFEPKLKQELSDSLRFLLCEETDPTWSNIRLRFKTVMKSTVFRLNKTFSEFGIDEEGRKEKIERIEEYAKDVVEAKAREEAGRAKQHMIRKFVKHFMYGSNSSPRDWQSHVEIERAAKAAISTPLDVLTGLAAIRLEADDADNIRQILFSAFLGSGDPNTLYQLDSHSWAQVPSSRTLITPIQCKQLWQGYLIGVKNAVNKAVKDLERKSPGWLECVVRILTSIISFPFEVINWFAGKIF